MKKLIIFFLVLVTLAACGKIRKELGLNDDWEKIEESSVLPEIVVEDTKLSICERKHNMADGGGERLWKPHSERTGTVVILMPQRYKNASFQLLDAGLNDVTSVAIRECCHHNGGRDHIYLNHTAANLEASKPLTLRFELGGIEECFTVPEPSQRQD